MAKFAVNNQTGCQLDKTRVVAGLHLPADGQALKAVESGMSDHLAPMRVVERHAPEAAVARPRSAGWSDHLSTAVSKGRLVVVCAYTQFTTPLTFWVGS